MNSVGSNNFSLKYQRFTTPGEVRYRVCGIDSITFINSLCNNGVYVNQTLFFGGLKGHIHLTNNQK